MIYTKHLKIISDIKFTFREADIISCILHNRGEKKIGSMLGISHRTVGSHVRNIMTKMGSSSRDSIIDFVEKSGTLPHFRIYYFNLVLHSIFKKLLQKIATLINRKSLNCGIFYDNLSSIEATYVKNIICDLKHANINNHINTTHTYNLYIISEQSKLVASNQNDVNIIIDSKVNLSLYEDHK